MLTQSPRAVHGSMFFLSDGPSLISMFRGPSRGELVELTHIKFC